MTTTILALPTAADASAGFDLDVRTVELAGVVQQINLTDDNCGGTCDGTACNTSV